MKFLLLATIALFSTAVAALPANDHNLKITHKSSPSTTHGDHKTTHKTSSTHDDKHKMIPKFSLTRHPIPKITPSEFFKRETSCNC